MTEPCGELEPLHSAWLDDELDAAARARVDRHLGGCQGCRAAVDGLRRTRAAVRNLPPRRSPVPPALPPTGRRPAAAAPGPAGLGGRRPRRVTRALAGAAFLLGLVTGVALAVGGPPPEATDRVAVPLDMFVVHHLSHTMDGPAATPIVVQRDP